MSEVFNIVLGAETLVLILSAAPILQVALQNPPSAFNVTLPAAQIINTIIDGPVQYLVQFMQAQIVLQVALTVAGPPGERGLIGPEGPRGSLFLGKYPGFTSLPPVDGVDIRLGDYAYLNDTGEMWILKG